MTRIPLDLVDAPGGQEILGEADCVEVVDDRKDFRAPLWGEHGIARGRQLGSSPHEIRRVEIEVDSTRPEEVRRAGAAVKRAKQK
jgi:hypothetical protein